MKIDYQFIAGLFNKAQQTVMQVNNLPIKAYKVRVNGNIAIIEALWVSKLGGVYTTKDVRTVETSKMQLDRLQRGNFEFFAYED